MFIPKCFFASSWNMLRRDLWHFHIHKLKGPVSIPQCPFTSVSFSVLLPFHRNRLKGALKVIFMAPSQVQKANVKTEANCWKMSLLLSSADTWTKEQVPYQWKKKPRAKSARCIFSSVSWAGWRPVFLLMREMEIVFALAGVGFLKKKQKPKKPQDKNRWNRKARMPYWRKVCWLLKFRALFLKTNLS